MSDSSKVIVRQIVNDYLEKAGFDGLVNREGVGCECSLSDLTPCYYPQGVPDCQPAHKVHCDGDCELGQCDWHMRTKEVIEGML